CSLVPSTGAAWPCGRERVMSNAEAAAVGVSPLRTCRKASICVAGQCERLAMVRLRTLPCSRKLSRRRMAGGELRLGTTATYMSTRWHKLYLMSSIKSHITCLHNNGQNAPLSKKNADSHAVTGGTSV